MSYIRTLEERLTDRLVGDWKEEYMGIIPPNVGEAGHIRQSIKNNQFRMLVRCAVAGILHTVMEVNKEYKFQESP